MTMKPIDSNKTNLIQDVPVSDKVNLMGFDREAMEAYFTGIGEKAFRASQVMKWIHQMGASDFTQMTNLSKALRASLTEAAEISVPEIISDNLSEDGTRKWLLKVPGKSAIEMVFIPEEKRGTLCVSSRSNNRRNYWSSLDCKTLIGGTIPNRRPYRYQCRDDGYG